MRRARTEYKPTELTTYLMLRVDPDTKVQLLELAQKHERDMSKQIRQMIRREYAAEFGIPQDTDQKGSN